MSSIINILHILIIVPLLFLVYYNQKQLPKWSCILLMLISSLSFIYHIYKLVTITDNEKWKIWIYFIHILFILPLIFYIGYNCNETRRMYFELLLLVSFAALGYHLFNLIKYGF